MRTFVIGCNHRSAPVEMRERIAFDESDLPRALQALTRRFPCCEAVLLSTCNRTELYVARPVHDRPRFEDVVEFIADFRGIAAADFAEGLYHYADAEAVRHLFCVVSSLDSMVLGETQIANQVKVAYDVAMSVGTIGQPLTALFHGRSACRRTFARGRTSHPVGSAWAARLWISPGRSSPGSTTSA